MKLTQHGTIEVDGCKVRMTQAGRWLVSRSGIEVGEVDSLAEVPILIERQKASVRDRLARIEAEAQAKRDARKDSFSI